MLPWLLLNRFLSQNSLPRINSEEIGQLCQSVLQDFDSAMSCARVPDLGIDKSAENGLETGSSDTSEQSNDHISRALMIQLVAMAIMSVTRLKTKGVLYSLVGFLTFERLCLTPKADAYFVNVT